MILVTGSTGNVGSEVVKQLAAKGHKVRALVRNKDEAKFGAGVEVAVGDLENADSLAAAMRGVEKIYALAPFTMALAQHDKNLIEAAQRAGVKHVVKHSVFGAQWESLTLGKLHRAGEKLLENSKLAWTFIRPGGFASNALGWAPTIKAQGKVYYPTGTGKMAVIDPRDIAASAVGALTNPGHEGKAYDLTGPELQTTGEQCAIIGKVIGKQVDFVDVPDSAAKESMVGAGMPAPIVDALLEFTNLVRSGQAAAVTEDVKKLTGTAPRTFESWARDFASAFK